MAVIVSHRFTLEVRLTIAMGVMQRCGLGRLWLAVSLLCLSGQLWSRVPAPPWSIDLTEFIPGAPVIFRGRVAQVSLIAPGEAVARFDVDRWYRNSKGSEATLYFTPYSRIGAMNGHDCIDFKLDAYWLVLGKADNGRLTLVDDCNGAVAISRLLGPIEDSGDPVAQMEADFSAGLDEADQNARIVSIQRLGGLKSPTSQPILHKVIEVGPSVEAKWALYAALRTGDVTILPNLLDLIARNGSIEAPVFMWYELQRLNDVRAIPGLRQIAHSGRQPDARSAALTALCNLKAAGAVPTMARLLTDPDVGVRNCALHAMQVLTGEPACTLSSVTRLEGDVQPQIQQCLAWWENTGKLQLERGWIEHDRHL